MTTLRVVQYLAPHAYGGIESIVRSLTLGLAQRGAQVTVAAMVPPAGPGARWVEQLRRDGADVEVLPPSWNLLRDSAMLAALGRRTRPHLIHSHGYRADIIGAIAAGPHRRIATVHGFNPVDARSVIYGHLDRLALRRYPRILAVSPVIRDRLAASGISAGRISVVLNGIDVERAPADRDLLRRELGMGRETHVIGTVGRLSPEKAHRDLLAAVARLERGLPWKVILVGDGPERRALEQQTASLHLSNRILMLGARTDLERIYPCFDTFVLPSHTEGSPTALLEAFAHGLPVVATRVGAIPEMLQDGKEGLLVPAAKPQALEGALLRLLRDAELGKEFGAAGRRRYQANFTGSAWLDRMEREYESTLT